MSNILPFAQSSIQIGGKGVRTVDPRIEVVSPRSPWNGKFNRLSSLPSPLEVVSSPWYLPVEVKNLMLRDPQVFAGYMLWKTGVLVDGIQVYPSKNTKDSNGKTSKTRERVANEIAEFCLYAFNSLRGGFHLKLLQLLDSCIWGHKAGVKIFQDVEKGRWKGKLILNRIRIMDNDDYNVRTDDFGNIVGLQSVNETGNERIYPIEKFVYSRFRPYNDFPSGSNILWPCYGPWWEKQQTVPERLANMAQFGSMSFWATTPEGINDIEVLGPDGLPYKYPATDSAGNPHPKAGQVMRIPIQQHMLDALKNFEGNGSVIVMHHGSELHKVEASNSGDTFRFLIEADNLEIIKAMFFTTGWTEQEKFSSNAKGKVTASIPILTSPRQSNT